MDSRDDKDEDDETTPSLAELNDSNGSKAPEKRNTSPLTTPDDIVQIYDPTNDDGAVEADNTVNVSDGVNASGKPKDDDAAEIYDQTKEGTEIEAETEDDNIEASDRAKDDDSEEDDVVEDSDNLKVDDVIEDSDNSKADDAVDTYDRTKDVEISDTIKEEDEVEASDTPKDSADVEASYKLKNEEQSRSSLTFSETQKMMDSPSYDSMISYDFDDIGQDSKEKLKGKGSPWDWYNLPSQVEANTYLEEHAIPELFQFLLAHTVLEAPDKPIPFIYNILQRLCHYHEGACPAPFLFENQHLIALFKAIDRPGIGYISISQYNNAMKSLGLTEFNESPVGTEENRITSVIFLTEAKTSLNDKLQNMLVAATGNKGILENLTDDESRHASQDDSQRVSLIERAINVVEPDEQPSFDATPAEEQETYTDDATMPVIKEETEVQLGDEERLEVEGLDEEAMEFLSHLTETGNPEDELRLHKDSIDSKASIPEDDFQIDNVSTNSKDLNLEDQAKIDELETDNDNIDRKLSENPDDPNS